MVEAIDKKYCHNNLVQLMHRENSVNLIISDDEILLLKLGDNILVNAYENHPDRYLFPYSDKVKNGPFYNGLFEYRKPYIVYNSGIGGYNFSTNYFLEGNDRALFWSEHLSTDFRGIKGSEMLLSREEIENFFDKDNYDSMYVIETSGKILVANSKNNGLVVDNKIIPSEEDIIEKDYRERKSKVQMGMLSRKIVYSGYSDYEETADPEKVERRSIDEITDLKLYCSGLFDDYGHVIITIKNGYFSINWFKIDMLSKDKFKLSTVPIALNIPTYVDVLKYMSTHKIEYTLDPSPRCKSFEEVHTPENMEFVRNSILKLMDDMNNPKEEEIESQTLLMKIFGKKRKDG